MRKRSIALTFAGLASVLLALYVGDYVLLWLRIQRGNGFESVTVRRYYAVPQKSGKIEFLQAEPQDQTCVRSLLPHMSDAPCWYLRRNTEQRIDI